MRFGLVGHGAIARAHATALKLAAREERMSDVSLEWVAGADLPKARSFASEFRVPKVGTIDELVESADAVIIASPSPLHAMHAHVALQAGKHVLCEIPLALSLLEVDRLIATADRAQRSLMVCHTNRFQPAFLDVWSGISSGVLHPYAVVVRYLMLARDNTGRTGHKRTWTDDLLWHHGCHAIDTALWLLGATETEVTARATRAGPLGIPMDTSLTLMTTFGHLVSVALSYNSHVSVFDVVVIGEENCTVIDLPLLVRQAELPKLGMSHPIARQLEEFVSSIREDRASSVSAKTIRATMAVLELAQRQIDSRATV